MAELKKFEQWQEIIEQLSSGGNFDPKYLRKFFTSNIVQRVFSYLFGWDYIQGIPVKLQATPEGLLRVSALPVYFSINETFSGNAPDSYGTPLTFAGIVQHVDIWVMNNDAVIQRSIDGSTWQSEITVYRDSYYGFDASTIAIRIRNRVAGSVAQYQIVGWR